MEIIIWTLVTLVVGLLVVIALPTSVAPEARTATAPEVLDGRKIRRVYGTVWIDDPTVLAWKPMGTVPIKSK